MKFKSGFMVFKRIVVVAITYAVLSTTIAFAYSEPSDWAKTEVERALNNGLVTESITSDYQKKITRESFCELVVKLYEKMTSRRALEGNDVFVDTDNTEILKAYNLGIVKGVSDNEFAPDNNITRQEICVMLTRCIDIAIEDADVSQFNRNVFSDITLIADWALPSVNYAFDNGIIKGVGNNQVDPLGNTTCEQAVLMVYRIYSNYDNNEETSKENNVDSQNNQAIIFEDEAFEYCVRYGLVEKKTVYEGVLTADLLKDKDTLTLYPKDENTIVESLKDLRYLPNLKRLYINNTNHNITDFSPIAQIKEWDEINLQGSVVKDDSFLNEINVRHYIEFPNLPETWVSAPEFDDEYTYKDALEMYNRTMKELDYISSNVIDDEMSDYEKYKVLYEYLIKKMRYDMLKYDSDLSNYEGYVPTPHELASVLVDGKGICQDYSSGYASLCTYFGLECLHIMGTADGINHTWNMVKIDGDYYHVDATWDDPDTDMHSDMVNYNYFLISDSEMSRTHVWDEYSAMIGTMTKVDVAELPQCSHSYNK